MKKFIACLLLGVSIFAMTACSGKDTAVNETSTTASTPQTSEESTEASAAETDTPASSVSVNVAALKGPTAMGMVKLMSDSENGETGENEYQFTIAASADEITPLLVKGDLDIAAVPSNLASVLYNKTQGEVQVLAINTLGVLYVVENGDTIQSIDDLKGKTIYSSGKGATPEYVLNYILSSNNMNPETDVTIEFKSEHTECVAALAQDPDGIAVLPQPFVTSAQASNENIRVALDLTKEWDKLQTGDSKSTLITGVIVARKEFIKENPKAVDLFLSQYSDSVDYVNANTEDAAALIEKYDIIKAAVASKALPYCNITYIEGTQMQEKLSGYLSVLFDQNPNSVGGTLPDASFYYSR